MIMTRYHETSQAHPVLPASQGWQDTFSSLFISPYQQTQKRGDSGQCQVQELLLLR